jgi:YolD-like protein
MVSLMRILDKIRNLSEDFAKKAKSFLLASFFSWEHNIRTNVLVERCTTVPKKINNLFASMRMVLPEQRAAILEYDSKRALQERPYIDDDELGEMCDSIFKSKAYDFAISVKWFIQEKSELGTIEVAWGSVPDIDVQKAQFKLVCDWDSHVIKFKDLISVTK